MIRCRCVPLVPTRGPLDDPLFRAVPLLGLLLSTVAFWITMGSEHLRRTSLLKWPLLLVFTVGGAVAVGFISSVYAHGTVIKAMSVTAATTLSVTLYTLLQKNPRYDLSHWGRALAGLSIAFLLYGVIHALSLFGVLPPGFLPHSEAVYGLCGAGLFSLYLAYHTRLIGESSSSASAPRRVGPRDMTRNVRPPPRRQCRGRAPSTR